MEKLCLKGPDIYSVTPLSNYFIDEIMPDANGEFVKVYLYLLRVLSTPNSNLSICHIADKLNHTEKDVIRALKYWEQAGLLQLQKDSANRLIGIQLLDMPYTTKSHSVETVSASIPRSSDILNAQPNVATPETDETQNDTEDKPKARRSYSASEVSKFKENQDVIQLLYVAERYMGRNLNRSDINVLLYIYDELHFPVELVEYLIEYCISNNHTSNRYIEKTALNWADEGIDTVEKAKANVTLYSNVCYPILKAFGISGRVPVKHEKDLIIKWTNNYGFSMDIILEACERTMKTATPPSFNYADSILTKWYQHGIRTKADIEPLDREHVKNQALHSKKTSAQKQNTEKKQGASSNSFNNFTQRNYNYEALEKELLGNV